MQCMKHRYPAQNDLPSNHARACAIYEGPMWAGRCHAGRSPASETRQNNEVQRISPFYCVRRVEMCRHAVMHGQPLLPSQ